MRIAIHKANCRVWRTEDSVGPNPEDAGSTARESEVFRPRPVLPIVYLATREVLRIVAEYLSVTSSSLSVVVRVCRPPLVRVLSPQLI